jgi:glutaredoxin
MNLKQNLKPIAINVTTIALAIAIGMPAGNYIMSQFKPRATPQGPVALVGDTANLVFKDVSTDFVLFATTTCNYCKDGIQLLDKTGVSYKVYYIDKDVQAEKIYTSMNIQGIPTLFSKTQYINGFNTSGWKRFISKTDTKLSPVVTKTP